MERSGSVDKKKVSPAYRVIKWLVKTFYPVIEPVGTENLPEEPALIVGNHSQMNGPSPVSCIRRGSTISGVPGR